MRTTERTLMKTRGKRLLKSNPGQWRAPPFFQPGTATAH
jgi:hypothetical protein